MANPYLYSFRLPTWSGQKYSVWLGRQLHCGQSGLEVGHAQLILRRMVLYMRMIIVSPMTNTGLHLGVNFPFFIHYLCSFTSVITEGFTSYLPRSQTQTPLTLFYIKIYLCIYLIGSYLLPPLLPWLQQPQLNNSSRWNFTGYLSVHKQRAQCQYS